jgi:quinol monooxygenase YgiN
VNDLIIESIRIAVSAARRDQLKRDLAAWSGPAGVESGCISCKILQEDSDPLAFCYQARWKTRDDLLRHLRADHYKRLLALLDLATEPPQIEFHTVSETNGLELIKQARNVA